MGEIKFIAGLTMFAIFTLSILAYAIGFGVENDTSININQDSSFSKLSTNIENNIICPKCHEPFQSFKPNQLVCWICSKKDKNKNFFKSKPQIQERFVQEVKSKHSKIKVIRMEVPKCQVKLNY